MDLELPINVLCFIGGVFYESESVFASRETCVSKGHEMCF